MIYPDHYLTDYNSPKSDTSGYDDFMTTCIPEDHTILDVTENEHNEEYFPAVMETLSDDKKATESPYGIETSGTKLEDTDGRKSGRSGTLEPGIDPAT